MSSSDNQYQYYDYESEPFGEQHNDTNRPHSLHLYVDPSLVTTLVTFLLIAAILIDSAGALVSAWESVVLQKINAGAYETLEELQIAADANDTRVAIVGLAQMLVAIVLGIVFLCWTYRVCKNAHSFNLAPMANTPGWAVGWYFIPIFNLWRPYMALKEAFHASCHPAGQEHGGTAIFGIWWFTHILGAVLGQVIFRMAMEIRDEPEMSQLIVLNGIQIVGDIEGIILNVLTLVIVRRFARCQRETLGKMTENFV